MNHADRIKIARDFSRTPGGRFIADGPFSGEAFRKDHLERHFRDNRSYRIEIDLDGVAGYATSFLEEAFGGLAREFSTEAVLQRLAFVSEEDPLLAEEVQKYIGESRTRTQSLECVALVIGSGRRAKIMQTWEKNIRQAVLSLRCWQQLAPFIMARKCETTSSPLEIFWRVNGWRRTQQSPKKQEAISPIPSVITENQASRKENAHCEVEIDA